MVFGARWNTWISVCSEYHSNLEKTDFLGKYLHRRIQGSFGKVGHRHSSSSRDHFECYECHERYLARHRSKARYQQVMALSDRRRRFSSPTMKGMNLQRLLLDARYLSTAAILAIALVSYFVLLDTCQTA